MTDRVLFATLDTASGHRIGRATLNAPSSLNALDLGMVEQLDEQLAAWADDPSIVMVLLEGQGDRAFCAGGDVVGLARQALALGPGVAPPVALDFFEVEYRLDHRIHTYPKPLLAWGHGIVMGGGVGLLIGASHRVVTPATRLAMPEITIGLYPDVGGSWFLPRLPGRLGLFLALTSAPLNAADACHAGMADLMLRHEDRELLLQALQATGWQARPEADRALLGGQLQALAQDRCAMDAPAHRHRERIDGLIGFDTLATFAPRLAALADDPDPWLAAAGRAFAAGSPSSAALGVEMQRRARHLSLADAFRLEWQASVGCMRHPDFAEGVRALLIDKDKSPRWRPATLAEVDQAWIEAHLAMPDGVDVHPLAALRD